MPNKLTYKLLNFSNPSELHEAVRIHCECPNEWIEDLKVSADQIEAVKQQLLEGNENSIQFFMLVKDIELKIAGIHWVTVNKKEASSAGEIVSLWVDPSLRNRGIASNLKNLGEEWLRARGINKVESTVYLANKKMLAINNKRGFISTPIESKDFISMVKEL